METPESADVPSCNDGQEVDPAKALSARVKSQQARQQAKSQRLRDAAMKPKGRMSAETKAKMRAFWEEAKRVAKEQGRTDVANVRRELSAKRKAA